MTTPQPTQKQNQPPANISYFVGEIATQTSEVIANPDGQAMSPMEVQVKILNDLNEIKQILKNRL